ncbi:hypothetical protein MWLf4_1374 [Limosilactobacillus fermentum]|nr:hypothetical protein MWLf4_1374 [Limosilactobacillus fermentum]
MIPNEKNGPPPLLVGARLYHGTKVSPHQVKANPKGRPSLA